MSKLHIKKGDKVQIMTGKDSGRTGKVKQVFPEKNKAVVEGAAKVKRHSKPTKDMPQGGIVEKEAKINASNLLPVCPSCNKAARVGHLKEDGVAKRVCKNCGSVWEATK